MPFAKDDAYFFAGFQPNGVCYAPLTLGRPKTAHPTLIVMVEPNTPSDWYNLGIVLKTIILKVMGDRG